MSGLAFQEYELAGMKLRNRIVRSATFDPMGAEDAAVSEEQAAYYRMLAEHGIGLIISGMAAVSPDGASSKIQNGLYDDRFIAGHRMLTDAVHAAGGVVVAQINHTGDRAMGPERISPSGITSPFSAGPSHAASPEEIAAVTADFAAAAVRAKAAGYDGVQIHCAHGYLLSQFVNPAFNKRSDRYGGSCANRFRFAEEVMAAVRAAVGPDYPVMVKLNSNVEEGDETFLSDLIWMCDRCRQMGVCAVELSGYDFTPRGRKGERAYYLERAAAVRAACGLPVILVGGIRTAADMDRVLGRGIDMVALSRPFICEPDLVDRLLAGQEQASCLSCSKCFVLMSTYKTSQIRCILHKPPEAR